MKKVLVFSVALWLGIFQLHAQTYNGNVRSWEQGRLTWNDFSRQTARDGMQSELKYFLSYDIERQKINDTALSRIKVKSFMDKDSSWIDAGSRNNWELRYQQVIFDILENQCRIMQPEIDRCRSTSDLDSCLQRIFDKASDEIGLFRKTSYNGNDTNIILQWEYRMGQSLNKADTRNGIPSFYRALPGMGASIGIGSNLYSGKLKEYFSPKVNVNLGLELGIGRSELLLDATLGGCKVKKDSFFVNERWTKDDHIEFCQLSAAYGFRIIDQKKWQLMPFIGYGITEISTIAGQNDKVSHREKANGFLGGLCMDYRLRSSLNLVPNYLRSKECSSVSLRAKIYVSQVEFSEELQGMTINFSLGISMYDQFIKLR